MRTDREIWDDDIDFLINDASAVAIKGIDYESFGSRGASYPSSDPTIIALHGRVDQITRSKKILSWWAMVPSYHRIVLGDPDNPDNWGYYTRRNVWPVGAAVEFKTFVGAAFAIETDRDKLIDACSRRSRADAREYLKSVRNRASDAVMQAHRACSDAKRGSYARWAE